MSNPQYKAEWSKKDRAKYPEKYRVKSKKDEEIRKEKMRNWKESYKRNKSCKLCGYNKHTEILQFHHPYKDKKYTISGIRTKDKFLEEIKKCILLCPNCHMWFHYHGKQKL